MKPRPAFAVVATWLYGTKLRVRRSISVDQGLIVGHEQDTLDGLAVDPIKKNTGDQ